MTISIIIMGAYITIVDIRYQNYISGRMVGTGYVMNTTKYFVRNAKPLKKASPVLLDPIMGK